MVQFEFNVFPFFGSLIYFQGNEMNILSNISELHIGLNVNSLKADTRETNVYRIDTDLAENIFWNLSFFKYLFL